MGPLRDARHSGALRAVPPTPSARPARALRPRKRGRGRDLPKRGEEARAGRVRRVSTLRRSPMTSARTLSGEARLVRGRPAHGGGGGDARQPVGRRGTDAPRAARGRRDARLRRRCLATAARFPPSAPLHPPASRLERALAISTASWRSARRTAAAGSIMAAGRCATRSATARPGRRARRLRLPRGHRARPAPDSGRPRPCRDHRARPFPLPRQRRDGRAAGGAARLRPQGRRRADARGEPGARAPSSRGGSAATARSPTRSPSPARSRRRSGSRRPPRAHGCAA